MKIISTRVVPMSEVPVTIREHSRKSPSPKPKDTITQDAAARPYNEQFARAISNSPEPSHIVFDSTVGSEWQRKLK